jgi:hypothetical protein
MLDYNIKNIVIFLNFPAKEDNSKCLYELRVILTCYKKILGDIKW